MNFHCQMLQDQASKQFMFVFPSLVGLQQSKSLISCRRQVTPSSQVLFVLTPKREGNVVLCKFNHGK